MKNSFVLSMFDDIASTAARFSQSLKRHNVKASTDRIIDDLQGLLEGYAGGKNTVRASARTNTDEIPPYNMAADMIATASSLYAQGQTEDALRHVLIAFQSQGMTELAEALVAMNDEAEDAAQADAPNASEITAAEDDSDDEPEDDDISVVEAEDDEPWSGGGDDSEDDESEEDESEDEDDDEDDENEDDSDVAAVQSVLSEFDEPPTMEVSDDEDEDDEDESTLTSRFRSVSASSSREAIALANKVSLTGTTSARRIGKGLLD